MPRLAQKKKKGLVDYLTSVFTLVPLVAGVSALIVGWAIAGDDMTLYYLGAAGGVALAVLSVITQMVLGSEEPVDPALVEARQQLFDALEAIGAGRRSGQVVEAQSAGTPVQLEK